MSKNWKTAKLGDVSDFQGGSQPPKSQFVDEPREGYIRLLQIRDFKSDQRAVYIPVTKKNKVCNSDDVMIGRYGASVGQIHRGKAGAYNVALIKTIPNENLIDKGYFYLYLTSNLFQEPLMSVADRSAQAGFSKADIAPFSIPLPPLPVQKRIVAILDKAFADIDEAIANTEKNLAYARDIFESYLNDVFTKKGEGWVEKKLGEVSDINYGYTAKASNQEVGPKFLRITDIQDGSVNWDTVPFCSISDKEHAKHKLIDGDVVFARTGATTGKSYLLANAPDVVCASYLIRLRTYEGVFQPEFLILYFQTKKYWDQISIGVSGSAQGGFNASKLAELVIAVPQLKKQCQVATAASNLSYETRKLESIYQQKLNALNELKQSLLAKAFSGELTADSDDIMKEAVG